MDIDCRNDPGFLQINFQGIIEYANESVLEIFPGEKRFIGRPVEDVLAGYIKPNAIHEAKSQMLNLATGEFLTTSIMFSDGTAAPKIFVFIQSLEKQLKLKDLPGGKINKSIGDMESLFEIIDNMAITDGQGILLRVSHSWEDVHGVKMDETLGRSVYDLEQEGVFTPSVTVKVLKEGKKASIVQKNKRGRTLVTTAVPIFNSRQEIEYVVSWDTMDVTDFITLNDEYEILQNILQRQSAELRELRLKEMQFPGIVAQSAKMRNVLQLAMKVADVDTTVVITGESGVGKNLIAKLMHQHSSRREGPYIEINCGAIPDGLIESELFGYERGSFTGANQSGKVGQIELAHGGTLFLDEVAELPLNMQVKLLKVIQEKKISKLGGKMPVNVDFRLISATNRDLIKLVKEGLFREDLFYRLNVIPIKIPPLRERPEDILPLVLHFIARANENYKKEKSISKQALAALMRSDWLGNVRELENVIERVILLSDNNILGIDDFPEIITTMPHYDGVALKQILELYERQLLRKALTEYKTTVGISKALGLSQPSVVRKLKKYNIHS